MEQIELSDKQINSGHINALIYSSYLMMLFTFEKFMVAPFHDLRRRCIQDRPKWIIM